MNPDLTETADGVTTYAYAAEYEVTIFPKELLEDPGSDAAAWSVTVGYAGDGEWTVTVLGRMLAPDGTWTHEFHGYPLDQAMKLARRAAPGVRVNGHVAREVLEHYQRTGDWV